MRRAGLSPGIVIWVVGLLLVFGVLLYVHHRLSPDIDPRRNHNSDSYNRWGTRGLCELLGRQGFRTRAWRGRLDLLTNRHRIVFILSPTRHFTSTEVDNLLTWIEAGGTAVIAPSRNTAPSTFGASVGGLMPIDQLLGPMGLMVERGAVIAGEARVDTNDALLEGINSLYIPSHLRIVPADADRLRQQHQRAMAEWARLRQDRADSCSSGTCGRRNDDPPEDADWLRQDHEKATADQDEQLQDGPDSFEGAERDDEGEEDDARAETVGTAPSFADYLQPRLRPQQFRTLATLDGRTVLGLVEHGQGRVIVLAEADMLGNYWIRQADNAMLALNAVYNSGARTVYFDEYHNGYSPYSIEAEQARASSAWRVVRIALLGIAVFVLAQGIRFGAAVPRYRRARRSAREFVGALATLYQQAGASRAAVRIITSNLKQRVARAGRLGSAPSQTPIPNERLALECARRNPGIDEKRLLSLLNRLDAAATAPHRLDESELVRLGRDAAIMEKELLRSAGGPTADTRRRPKHP